MQENLHSPEHPPSQLEIQALEHIPSHPVAAKVCSIGNDESTTAPTTGSAALAAFLKNSRRDWSSSLDFLLDIKLKFLVSLGLRKARVYIQKKAWNLVLRSSL